MGQRYQMDCPSCGYSVVVSGGDDVGMCCRTTTIICEDCKELYDVVTSEEPWLERKESDEEELICPGELDDVDVDDEGLYEPEHSNPDHRVARWTYPGSCPRCGTGMQRGRIAMRWD